MRIAIIVEGKTEQALRAALHRFLKRRLTGPMPKLDFLPQHGRVPTGAKLKRLVERVVSGSRATADAVIALTDVYTGTLPPEFKHATDARAKMKSWVGENPRFYAHAAQFCFEAWLVPFWEDIQRLAGSNRKAPKGSPERINHTRPPSRLIQHIFRTGKRGDTYDKVVHAARILKDNDLLVAAKAFPELKAFLNTILRLCGGEAIP